MEWIIYIILFMKKEKLTLPLKTRSNSGLPAIENNAFNQTIIINNPNFNINYIEASDHHSQPKNTQKVIKERTLYDPHNSSKGIDAWNLNKNLKEFSETRQLGFYKGNVNSHKQDASPYLSHKNKTAQLRSYSKISPTPLHFRENRTLSTVKYTDTDRPANDQSKTTFRKRKFDTKPINLKHERSGSGFNPHSKSTLDPNNTFSSINQEFRPITDRKPIPTIRRNQFQRADNREEFKSIMEIVQKYTSHKTEEEEEIQNMEASLIDTEVASPTRPKANSTSKAHRAHRSHFEKSREKISTCFLKQADNYFDQIDAVDIPSSKIELYTVAITQPTIYAKGLEYRSTPKENYHDYDFFFEEEKKKRPKTPYKRKKMYEEA